MNGRGMPVGQGYDRPTWLQTLHDSSDPSESRIRVSSSLAWPEETGSAMLRELFFLVVADRDWYTVGSDAKRNATGIFAH